MPERAHLWTVTVLPLTVNSLWTSPIGERFACPQPDHRSLGQRYALTTAPWITLGFAFGLTTLTTGSDLRRLGMEGQNKKTPNRTLYLSMEPVMLTCYQHSHIGGRISVPSAIIGVTLSRCESTRGFGPDTVC